jgi:hypothetical protein
MNRIRINRLLVAGLATLFVFIVVEILVEWMIGRMFYGEIFERWFHTTDVLGWKVQNHVLNLLIALLNCTLLIWIYASLRPMYGVGTRTVLISSLFVLVLNLSVTLNSINLGLLPAEIGLIELGNNGIEVPIAMTAGAWVYEGQMD